MPEEQPLPEPPPIEVEEPPLEVGEPAADAYADPLAGLTADEEPAPAMPTWDEILRDCQFLARAQAAMLLDGASELLAAVGEWPAGRVEALKTRLIPAIDKAQKANPNEPLSVRLGNAVLTAWRVPVASDLLTVAFLADAPVPYDAFPGVQSTLRRHA
jgi:hypothetical protein